jgi:hypothetical protein
MQLIERFKGVRGRNQSFAGDIIPIIPEKMNSQRMKIEICVF